jgi:hypothetical protein
MIRLSKDYYVSHKNGYYQIHKVTIKGEKSKQAGEEALSMKTYPDILSAWESLKEAGEDGSKALVAMEQAKINYDEAERVKFAGELAKKKVKKAEQAN